MFANYSQKSTSFPKVLPKLPQHSLCKIFTYSQMIRQLKTKLSETDGNDFRSAKSSPAISGIVKGFQRDER